MNPKVAVVLPAYNGIKFIEEQLISISLQESVNVDIWVRDDGSQDGTLEFLEKTNLIHFIVKDGKGRLGVTGNLLELINALNNYEYVAFADQDDIWEKNHLSEAVSMLLEHNRMMFFPRYRVFKENGETLFITKKKKISPENALVENPAIGCGIVVNWSAIEIIRSLNISHTTYLDWQLYFLFSTLKSVIQGDEVTVNYRNHQSNLVGFHKGNMLTRIIDIKNILNRIRQAQIDFENVYRQVTDKVDVNLSLQLDGHFYQRKRGLAGKKHVFFRRSNKIEHIVFVLLFYILGF